MNTDYWQSLLLDFQAGHLKLEEVLAQLRTLPFHDLDFAKLDSHRKLRCGFPEVVFAGQKSPEELTLIVTHLLEKKQDILITRATPEQYQALQPLDPQLHYHTRARLISRKFQETPLQGEVLVLSAGTSDRPIAEEATLTAEMMGSKVTLVQDVGVAGIHRLFHQLPLIHKAHVIVVVAGMEGALPSVVSGLTDCPIIAVPTSVGYGTHFNGVTPLLAMLNSCASGMSVVNIDNGFGAGYQAALINRKIYLSHLNPA